MFLETIKIAKNQPQNLSYHQQRMDLTRKYFFNTIFSIDLKNITKNLPNLSSELIYKLRIIYAQKIEYIEIQPYFPQKITSLKIIHNNEIDYNFKYAERNNLIELYQKKENCDDILIIKNNEITDTSYANIAFLFENQWITPKNPLLSGTMRQVLLDKKIIKEEKILLENIKNFQKAKIFNSMLEWQGSEIEIDKIQ
jgi:4-amino-4-deoxychorismate lyase